MTDEQGPDNREGVSRRRFIKNSGMVAGGVIGGSLLGGFFTNQYLTEPESKTKNEKSNDIHLENARMYFSRKEDFDILKAATERLFPKDDNGPGAIALGVPYFIDRQLAGYWGSNSKDYMHDPFKHSPMFEKFEKSKRSQDKQGPNAETQNPMPSPRYQSRLTRGEIFIEGLRSMDKLSQDRFDEKFADATVDQQTEILQAVESGDIDIKGVAASTFFNLLLQTTIEGAYADPLYGGNRNMDGWRMKEYPGPRMGYLNDIEKDEFIKTKPKSLTAYQAQ